MTKKELATQLVELYQEYAEFEYNPRGNSYNLKDFILYLFRKYIKNDTK